MTAAAAPVVRLQHVVKTYHAGAIDVAAIRDISLDVPSHRFTMIVGPSGSGKTTLLNLIGCIDAPTAGRIEVCGEDVGRLKDNALADFRARNIGFIFQSFSLVPVLSAYENVEYPLLLRRHAGGRAPPPHAGDAGGGRVGGPGVAAAERIVRRPEAARGDRAGPGEAPDHRAGGRTDRESRQRQRCGRSSR